MTQFRYGPVELYLVGLAGDRPAPGVIEALRELIAAGTVRLLDFLLVSRSEDGEVSVVEIDDRAEEYGFGDLEFAEIGLAGDEDVEELASLVEPGTTAALVVVELTWAKRLAERVAASDAEVLSVERIPAPVVNAVVDMSTEEA